MQVSVCVPQATVIYSLHHEILHHGNVAHSVEITQLGNSSNFQGSFGNEIPELWTPRKIL